MGSHVILLKGEDGFNRNGRDNTYGYGRRYGGYLGDKSSEIMCGNNRLYHMVESKCI